MKNRFKKSIKASKREIPKLKRKLTRIFNEYVRLRDKIKFGNETDG
jgi:hypothetical protein